MQTETTLTLASQEQFELWRYPKQAHHSTLRAWDSTDLYLINELKSEEKTNQNILIINDSFGALSCALADFSNISWYNDSKVAELGLINNLESNHIDQTKIHRINTLTSQTIISGNFDKIIIKLPKSNAYLDFILHTLHNHASSTCDILIAAKSTEFTPNIIKKLKSLYEETTPSRIVKKSRYISLKHPKQLSKSFDYWQISKELLNDTLMYSAPNVFSRGKLDIGGRFLASHLPKVSDKSQILDLGCGNGLLGIELLKQNPLVHVDFCDESAMAVESAKHNCQINGLNTETNLFMQMDCAAEAKAQYYDLIVCNPPFHQLNAITDHIAHQMFSDALRVLKTGGELRIVGNRHLAYQQKLIDIFGHYSSIAQNDKFVILSTIKK